MRISRMREIESRKINPQPEEILFYTEMCECVDGFSSWEKKNRLSVNTVEIAEREREVERERRRDGKLREETRVHIYICIYVYI